jgi:hypothetical protein
MASQPVVPSPQFLIAEAKLNKNNKKRYVALHGKGIGLGGGGGRRGGGRLQ